MFTLDHIAITVRSLKEAVKFYEGLGFRVLKEKHKPELGVAYALLQFEGLTLELLTPLEGEPAEELKEVAERLRRHGLNHISLRVENLEEACRRLRDKNVRILAELKPPSGSKLAFFLDEEGNLFELIEKS